MVLDNKKRTINTRTRYKIVGSDYSAQEPRSYDNILVRRSSNV